MPQQLLVDYLHVLERTVPSLERLIAKQDEALREDSVLIAEQRKTLAMYDRQLDDFEDVTRLYEEEIEKRREIERLYGAELRRMKWWRRGAVAGAVAGLAILILK